MIQFNANNNLKSEPRIMGLRISNIINLAMILVISLIFYGVSEYLALSKSLVGLLCSGVFLFCYFYLKKVERSREYEILDKRLANMFQPKEIAPTDMKLVFVKRLRNRK